MNYAQILKSSFDPYFQAPLEIWEGFFRMCKVVSVKKGIIIKEYDATENYFYFIVEGAVGVFLWKENTPVCLDFAFDGQFCSDYMSILTGEPTPLYLMTLEDCLFLRMSKEKYNELTQMPIGKIIRLVAGEVSFVDKQRQQIELLTKTASQRYHLLLKQFPDIQNRVAQQHIASYLGITPQSLSRIKREN
ncbi:Crp/Fnr family transcriptional regulator [Mongoliitalea lutea]|uniref:Crp/Fnr family transcriptional regulator n=1 Tax=Mongoliitalea lutea TaxID=849756 RepID=A0A8J3G4P6_9BACT|nr:Crp/Fnr family transcriptional regulator [Mongoliitalea lutea]GHB32238.1 Crp/Fnr family transcriptional regulator [Mongoliitalea lutea]